MPRGEAIEELVGRRQWIRAVVVGVLLIATGVSHWITPTSHRELHLVHVILRKLFIVPIVLAAIWFEMRGALIAAGTATVLYAPHVLLQWTGRFTENINQVGEIATMWVTAVLSGVFVGAERRALREVADTHRGTLLALVAALDAREHETELHSVRVRAYALRIARELGMPREEQQILGQAALLHDVGKVGTPDHILLKPEALTDTEWRLMWKHPEVGRRILLSVPFLRETAEVVRCHHERYDGKGYPRGLRGDEIPFSARVFAVVDVFDALISDRPYHRKMDCASAREEIRKEAGNAFDPNVVRAFLRISCEEWADIRKALTPQ